MNGFAFVHCFHGLPQLFDSLAHSSILSHARRLGNMVLLPADKTRQSEEVVEHFKRWAMKPEMRELIFREWPSPE
jgi:hypothetical protein